MMRRRRWIHCSSQWHGERWTAQRRCPALVELTSEPKTPRLCVCATVAACFSATLFQGGDVCVYRTAREVGANAPRGVWDAAITGERWIVPPCVMELHSVIPASVVRRVTRPHLARLKRGGPWADPEPLRVVERIRFYARSLPILESAGVAVPAWEKRLLSQAMARLVEAKEAA